MHRVLGENVYAQGNQSSLISNAISIKTSLDAPSS